MTCRKIYEDSNHYSLVFFNSDGLTFPQYLKVKIANYNSVNSEIDLSNILEVQTISGTLEYESNDNTHIEINYEIKYDSENINKSYFKLSSPNIETFIELGQIYVPKNNKDIALSIPYIETIDYSITIPFCNFAVAIKDNNYAEKQEGCAYSLTQRISIIKGELWWMINYGLPIFDKIRNKAIFDSVLINIILKHPDVKNIIYINSFVEDHTYTFEVQINTVFNENITISNKIMA